MAHVVEVRQSLPSQVAIISPFVDQLMSFVANFRKLDGSEFEIELALREALANAVVHGNHEDPRRQVYVVCRCSPEGEVSITIQDEGQGFDNRAAADPTAPENRLLTHGRGVYLMRTSMDEVRYEKNGALVYMRKKANGDQGATRKPQ